MTAPIDHGQWRQSGYALTACRGKEALDRKTAERVAQKMRRKDRPACTYRCRTCGQWHVGTKGPHR